MKRLWEDDGFCEDSFELSGTFRAETVARMARAGRQARGLRAARRGVLAACAVGIVFLSFWRKGGEGPTASVAAEVAGKPGWIVNTEALPEEMLVRTRQVEGFVVNSRGGAVFEILTDEQMLALAQDQSVALVRMGGVTEVKWFGL